MLKQILNQTTTTHEEVVPFSSIKKRFLRTNHLQMVQHECWEQRVNNESLLEAAVDLQKDRLEKEEGMSGHSSAGN